jgi:DNA polymerase III gamma/tau subunit
LLDQLSSGNQKVGLDDVLKMLGKVPDKHIEELATTIETGSAKQLLEILAALRLQGYSAPQIAKQLGEHFRRRITKEYNKSFIELLKKLLDVAPSPEPEQLLDLVLLEYLLNGSELNQESIASEAPQNLADKNQVVAKPKPAKITKPAETGSNQLSDDTWSEILEAVRKQHNTLYSFLRMAEPSYDGKHTLMLTFRFAFHQKRISEAKNIETLRGIIDRFMPGELSIVSQVSENQIQGASSKDKSPENIETISNIFGGAEVLDS